MQDKVVIDSWKDLIIGGILFVGFYVLSYMVS